jgi:hypothetical protein
MKTHLYILGIILTLSCTNRKEPNWTENQNNILKDSISIIQPKDKNQRKYRWDTLYISGNNDSYVIGDSITKQINYIAIKFEPHILFTDFPVDSVYNNQEITIDWTSNKDAKRFKTRITETCNNEGVNFAGHYCFVFWGCGSPCQSSVMVDALTGKIYDGLNAALGYYFKIDSRMVIVNPPDSTGYYLDCPYCKPLIYIWDEKNNRFIKR